MTISRGRATASRTGCSGRRWKLGQAEPLTGSGVDVWVKRTRDLILNQMYASGKYYDVNAESQDDYRVGTTLAAAAGWEFGMGRRFTCPRIGGSGS